MTAENSRFALLRWWRQFLYGYRAERDRMRRWRH
jgi:hypothetical protein